ncbi:MAG: oxidoreductase [Actinobacteria bacterium HGW-Actinobacteria-6]|nr:MAG: oxidoreductase [Actinobacteria bacterium HGW-Actinobacteria-6]
MPTIAFVGTGVMGHSMAGHLLDSGYPLVVFNRTREKAAALIARGARWASSAGEAASLADVTITIVGYPADVEAVYLAPDGILAKASSGAIVIDMTTSTPTLAVRIAEAATARGILALDAPVSGGDIGAREARLTIMVGGDSAAFDKVHPIFQVLGKTVTHMGGPGLGQHTKMANQIAIAGTMLSVVEALAYARATGLDPERVLGAISAGSAGSWSMSNYGPRILAGDMKAGFYVKHFIKDLRIALSEAEAVGLELPGLDLARRLYERLAESGGGDLGTQALWTLYGDKA